MPEGDIGSRLQDFGWMSEREADCAGLSFYFDDGLVGSAPSADQIHVFKAKRTFELYAEVLEGQCIRRVMELGIWNGGSALVLAIMLEVEKLVTLDINGPVAQFDRILASNPIGRRIAPHYYTSQDDEAKLAAIVSQELNGSLDLVIDDASHFYGPSRASFEILFPRLRPGGWYIIEDWGWAHGELGDKLWPTQPSLASLVFELQLALFGSQKIIGNVIIKPEMVLLQKAAGAPVNDRRLSLNDLYNVYHRSAPLIV